MKKQFKILAGLSVLTLAACGGQSGIDPSGMGKVSIALSSSSAGTAALMAPSISGITCPAVTTASVTVSSMVARTTDAKLVDVTSSYLPFHVNLLALGSGTGTTLPDGFLPPGTYDQLIVVMNRLELELMSGMKIAITPPGGGWTAIVPVAEAFTVVAGQTTAVQLVFRPDLSFICKLGDWDFKPEFECGGQHGHGEHGNGQHKD